MRGIILLYSLFHADRHARLEPEFQKGLAGLDAFQQLLHQRLIKLRDGARLGIDEISQFPDSLLALVLGSLIHV